MMVTTSTAQPKGHPQAATALPLDPALFNPQVLAELAHLWPEAKPVRACWDNFRRRLVASNHQPTYQLLYGNRPLLREWHGPRFVLGRLRRILSPDRWADPLEFSVDLPPDAVAWGGKNVLFVASAQAGRFLKVTRGTWLERQVRGEVEAWNVVTRAGMAAHIPQLVDHGETRDGACWICTQLVPNRPSWFFQNADRLWLRRLRNDILPAMQTYYERSGMQVLSDVEWLDELKTEVMELSAGEPISSLVEKVADSLPSHRGLRIARARVHGDMNPRNAHFCSGKWWLFDWTADSHMAVIWDVFGGTFLDHCKHGLAGDGKQFWAWLRGDKDAPMIPDSITRHARLWKDWQQSWLGVQIPLDGMRFQILAMCLEWYLRMRLAWGASDDRVFGLLGLPTDPMASQSFLNGLSNSARNG